MGNDTCTTTFLLTCDNFNPRSLVGNDSFWGSFNRSWSNFNPRSLVGNDESDTSDMISSKISIHVPSWGTTDYRHTGSKDRKNFNPRSLVGNDDSATRQRPAIWAFQSTFPRGERPDLAEYIAKPLEISIHVPSWGTTRSLFDLPFPLPISIHVPSWGTTSMLAGCGKAYPFQSTFPRGERLYSSRNLYHCWDFNPRSLVGNDEDPEIVSTFDIISIHVPSWGTTAASGKERRYAR